MQWAHTFGSWSLKSMPANDVNQYIEAFWPKLKQLRSTRLFQLWSKSYCNCRLNSANNSLGLRAFTCIEVATHRRRRVRVWLEFSPRLFHIFLFTISYNTHCSKKTWKTQARRRRLRSGGFWIWKCWPFRQLELKLLLLFLPFRNLSHSRAYELNIVVERRI